MSILEVNLKQGLRKAIELQRIRMIDEHRHKSKSHLQDICVSMKSTYVSWITVDSRIQGEQETVLSELSDALSSRVRHALEEHAQNLKGKNQPLQR